MQTREEKIARLMKYGGEGYTHIFKLDEEFPEVGLFGPDCIGADTGAGWENLVRPVLAVMSKHGYKMGQLKAKFCILRVYCYAPAGVTDIARAEVSAVIAAAEDISSRTCEYCGTPSNENPGLDMSGVRLCAACRSKR